MKQQKAFKISDKLEEAFTGLAINRSAAISLAIMNAHERPEALGEALNQRLTQGPEEFDVRVTCTFDPRVEAMLDKLGGMSKLPIEQVIRLAMEAYISKL